MAGKKDSDDTPKRLNRTVPLGEAIGKSLDPAFRKRGFASRDLVEHWATIAPAPYGEVTRPDKLVWPRGETGAEGAVLHLRCHPGHTLALAHEGQRLTAAINRYFGYFLVGRIKLSAEPLAEATPAPETVPAIGDVTRARISRSVDKVGDPEVRDALRQLGTAMAQRRLKQG